LGIALRRKPLGRLEAWIDVAGFHEARVGTGIFAEPIRLAHRALPVKAEPIEVSLNRLVEFRRSPLGVRVVDAQDACTSRRARRKLIQKRCSRVRNIEEAVRTWGKAEGHGDTYGISRKALVMG
jgi:hypothetical protein